MLKKLHLVVPVLLAAVLWGGLGSAIAAGQDDGASSGQELALGPHNVEWGPCGVPQFPGCEAALLHGDPSEGPYSMYVRLPAGAEFPPHWHTNSHYLVGIEGTLTFAYKDGSLVTLAPGTFGYWPGNELMMGRCTSADDCIYYDHQISFGDVHFPPQSAGAGDHSVHR